MIHKQRLNNRILSLVLVLVMVLSTLPVASLTAFAAEGDVSEVWDGATVATAFAGGTGAENDPYLISNGAQLAYLAQQVNNQEATDGTHYKLTADIDLGGHAWTPIGKYNLGGTNYPFAGTFDGAGYTISNILINNGNDESQGLFGCNSGTIKNVGVIESSITAYDSYVSVGGVCGHNVGTIANCYNAGQVTGDASVDGVGGVCGTNDGTIENCYNTGTVSGEGLTVGGVCGYNGSGTITNCYNTGKVISGRIVYTGGVCGSNDGTIENCYNTGTVSGGEGATVGGVCGSNDGTIENCYNTGTVSGGEGATVGGVCGSNDGTIANCYNTGAITGGSSARVGGMCGSNWTTIANCYNMGTVSGEGATVGSMCGNNDGMVKNCYYLSETETEDGGRTTGQFASGEVACLLGVAFGQNIDNDGEKQEYPVLGGARVYLTGACTDTSPTYSNTNSGFKHGDFVDGICSVCSEYEAPEQDENGVYLIGSAGNLYWFEDYVNNTNAGISGKLTADIVLPDVDEGQSNWTPIGTHQNPYTGTFDGTGHTIANIQINSGENNQGLFGNNGGTIKNVGVIESSIRGSGFVGSVCGTNDGMIENCYNTGEVYAGRYADNFHAGGVCGSNDSTIENCYNTGTVSGDEGVTVGGVTGRNDYGTFKNCYYLSETETEDGGRTTGQFASGEVTYLLNNGTTDGTQVWYQTLTGDNAQIYPQFSGARVYLTGACTDTNPTYSNTNSGFTHGDFANGICSDCGEYEAPEQDENGVYLIGSAGNLYWFEDYVNNTNAGISGKLTKDIVLPDVDEGQSNWTPIGTSENPYTGTFDGTGYTIANIQINSEEDKQGLFGYNSGTIKNVGVIESSIRGSGFVGGVCGYNAGTIENCYNAGEVTGNDYVGGVCGSNEDGGTINNCYNAGEITGSSYVGGVCGINWATIENCYNAGEVTGVSYVGGVRGSSLGMVKNCYYLSETETEDGGRTTEQFASGEVTYLLNNGTTDGTQVWYQTLTGDDAQIYPQFSGAIVYYDETQGYNNHVHAWEYTVDDSKITATCTASGCTNDDGGSVTIVKPTSLTYTGEAIEAVVTNTLTTGDEVTVIYTATSGGLTEDKPVNAGSYTASITITDGDGTNHTASVDFEIKKAAPVIGNVSANSLQDTLDVLQVVLTRTDTTVDGTLELTDDTLQYGTHTYNWKFTPTGDYAVNYKEITGTVEITVSDTIAPTATYQIGTDGWKQFINTITFGLFCKDYKTVEISYSDVDNGSGVATKQYYVSDKEIADTSSVEWKDYIGTISLNAEGTYFIYVRVADKHENEAILNSEGIVIYAESTISPAASDYVYKENTDRTVQITMNGNTFAKLTDGEGNEIAADNYTIDKTTGTLTLKAAYLDTLDKGAYTYKIYMNPQGVETTEVTLAYTFTVNVTAKELTVTGATATSRDYNNSNTVGITGITLDGVETNDTVSVDLNGVQGKLSSANAGVYTSVTLPELILTGEDAGNYTLVQPIGAVTTSVEIYRINAVIIVGTDTYSKTFGDAAFTLDVTDTNDEANVQYDVSAGADVVSVSNGTVTILKAGTATITVSMPESTNYNAADSKTITLTVNKAENAPNMPGSTMSVPYSSKTVSAVSLPDGWAWQDADKDEALEAGVTTTATAVYVGTDKGNYENEAVVIAITRSECEHANTEVRNAKAATCTEAGHTGDTYCTDCDTKLSSGTATDAMGHDYSSEVTKEPTTTEEGIMTYTCSVCEHTYTKAIEKLTDDGSDNDGDNIPDAEKPFIKDDEGKEGWDVIRDEVEDAKDGDTVTVDMNGATVVPGDVFDDIRGRDVTIVFDMGNGITWSVNGQDITSDNVGDIDFSVKVGTEENPINTIPVEVINKVTGERYFMNISLAYDGEFGFTAVLSLNMDAKNAGLFANLYYYNEQAGEMEFICADEIAEDGTAELTFTHASEYTIIIDANAMGTPDTDGTQDSSKVPPTGDTTDAAWKGGWIILLGAVVMIIGFGVFFVRKKEEND